MKHAILLGAILVIAMLAYAGSGGWWDIDDARIAVAERQPKPIPIHVVRVHDLEHGSHSDPSLSTGCGISHCQGKTNGRECEADYGHAKRGPDGPSDPHRPIVRCIQVSAVVPLRKGDPEIQRAGWTEEAERKMNH